MSEREQSEEDRVNWKEQRDRYIDREIESEGRNEGEIPGRAKGPSAAASLLFSTGQENSHRRRSS